jgi:hypothetical protein
LLLASALWPLQDREIECLQDSLRAASFDLETFDALVVRHRLLPTIHRNLSTYASGTVLESVLFGFKERVERSQRLVLYSLAELGRVSKLFEADGIQLCALKGPLLSQRLFGDVSLRTSRDIDLLVHPEAVARAEAVLLAGGYQRSFPTRTLTPHQWQVYMQHWRHFVYYHPQRHIVIELHWALTSTDLFSMQAHRQMLSRARPVALAGAKLYTLSDEDLPVYLLIHGSLHCWIRLKWLVDFVAWMRQATESDWEGLKSRMGDLGLQRLLAQGALLANRLFDAPIPETIQALIQAEPAARSMADRSQKFILDAQITDEEMENVLAIRYIPYWMRLKPGLRYKWNTLIKYTVNPRDWMKLPLPDALYPLYWLLRPFLRLKRDPSFQRKDAVEDTAT